MMKRWVLYFFWERGHLALGDAMRAGRPCSVCCPRGEQFYEEQWNGG
jgi:hypothetical protein